MIKNGIIPHIPVFYEKDSKEIIAEKDYLTLKKSIDYKALCTFAACGFFLDDDTHFLEIKTLQPATEYTVDNGKIVSQERYFKWYNSPENINLDEATEAFATVFHRKVNQQVQGKKAILPLSGGLDSRSLAAALKNHPHVQAYSYEFEKGESETWYSQAIAKAENFQFHAHKIGAGYLWNCIEPLAKLNNCFAEFTHPRQMAVIDEIEKLGDCFFLGHWGDVLFDGMGVAGDLAFDKQVEVLFKKVLKLGGKDLGNKLWQMWGLSGTFEAYLKDRLTALLQNLPMENANSRIRAFKSMYWAPRWTSANMNIFRRTHDVAIPYYSDDMCQFICGIPEELLNGRQIQIEYLKRYAPELAKIKWQGYGLNLYNYQNFYKWYNIPNRMLEKAKRSIMSQDMIKRNWELQFMGESNHKQLTDRLLHPKFNELIDRSLVNQVIADFNKEQLPHAHPISILLTLSVFQQIRSA